MARKLRTYQTSIGFFDLAVAAASMKAALEIWGADSNLFHQGFATETDDPAIVSATVERPGVVLRRPVGTNGAFKENAKLPTNLASGKADTAPRRPAAALRTKAASKVDGAKARDAATAFEEQEQTREVVQRKEDLARVRERECKNAKIAKAREAIDVAKQEHDARNAAMQAEREALEDRGKSEDERWDKQREKLAAALRRAKDDDRGVA